MKTLQFRAIIFDIDGVLEFQGRAIPGALEVLETLRKEEITLSFLTNSTLKSRASCAAKLKQHGFQVADDEVVTASYATAEYLRMIQPRSVWVMLQGEGITEFKDFVHDEVDPEYIVVGDYRSGFRFDNLNHALRLLRNGAKLVGMQNELTDGSLGDMELNVGAWTSMLERASGVQATYIGKPFRYAFDLALRSFSVPRAQVLVVGDQVTTDILGARNAGLRSALIKTGEFLASDLDRDFQPDWILEDIRSLPNLFTSYKAGQNRHMERAEGDQN